METLLEKSIHKKAAFCIKPYVENAELALRTTGDCMHPTIQDGDIVYLRKTNLQALINNKIYVFDIKVEIVPLIKRYKPSMLDEYISLVPDNPLYRSMLVPKHLIVGVYEVLDIRPATQITRIK